MVLDKLEELLSMRGRKGTSIIEQMSLLQRLRQEVIKANLHVALQVKVFMQCIASHFDDSNSVSSFMSAIEWHACHDDIMEILILLSNENKDNLRLITNESEEENFHLEKKNDFGLRSLSAQVVKE